MGAGTADGWFENAGVKGKNIGVCVKGRRHDVGDKLGFLEAEVKFALQRNNLRDVFLDY